jgi:hypothetical protein
MVSYMIPKCASIAGKRWHLIGCNRRPPVDFRAGAMHAFDPINHLFLIGQILGQNMAWLLKKINA